MNRDERDVADLLATLTDEDFRLDEPPADLWARIDAAVNETDSATEALRGIAADAGPRVLGAGASIEAADAAPTLPAPVTPIRRRRPWLPLTMAAAAAVVLVLVVATVVVRSAVPSETELARARLTSEGLSRQTGLVGRAELVDVDGTREIALDLPGLDDQPDAFYELWLLAPDATRLQSLGTTDGHGRYRVPAAIDPREFPVVDVSREPPDGNPAHSGDSLVRGALEF